MHGLLKHTPPASASEIHEALGITKSDIDAARRAIESSITDAAAGGGKMTERLIIGKSRPPSVLVAKEGNIYVFSSGGGVQSTAALILSARGEINFPVHVFANTGDDSENPDTLFYVRNVLMPYAQQHRLTLVETAKRWKGTGPIDTLLTALYRRPRSVPIPMRGHTGAPGRRACTVDWKIRVVDKWIAEHGGRGYNVFVGLGITVDEIQRARTHDPTATRGFMKHIVYPFVDLNLTRDDCIDIIADEGLPRPPRSACWFCPYHSPAYWLELRETRPELFRRAAKLEHDINAKRGAKCHEEMRWLHRALCPLEEAVSLSTQDDGLDNCESGYCMV